MDMALGPCFGRADRPRWAAAGAGSPPRRPGYPGGLFEFIEIKQEDTPEGRVNLVVEVTPKYRVSAVRFQGNKQVKSRRLQDEVATKPNSALDERTVKVDAEKIHEYYQKAGYNQAQVSYDIEGERATG